MENKKITYPDGTVYEGGWRQQEPHGKGKIIYRNGDVYKGEFGDVFKGGWRGRWEYGYKEGKGTMTYSNGDIYEGGWKDDKWHGKGKITYSDGETQEGSFVEDKKESRWFLNLPDGRRFRRDYFEGRIESEIEVTKANRVFEEKRTISDSSNNEREQYPTNPEDYIKVIQNCFPSLYSWLKGLSFTMSYGKDIRISLDFIGKRESLAITSGDPQVEAMESISCISDKLECLGKEFFSDTKRIVVCEKVC